MSEPNARCKVWDVRAEDAAAAGLLGTAVPTTPSPNITQPQ
jgi:hypothetical protein